MVCNHYYINERYALLCAIYISLKASTYCVYHVCLCEFAFLVCIYYGSSLFGGCGGPEKGRLVWFVGELQRV